MNRLLGALFVALSIAVLPAAADGSLQVEDAWVREGPPTAEVLAGFMHLQNPGSDAVQVTGVTSPAFERVEIHRSVTENGMAKMIAQDKLTVPAGGDLLLAPGSYHLMLLKPKQPLRAGMQVEFVLHTAGGDEVSVQAEVRTGMGGMMDHHHH